MRVCLDEAITLLKLGEVVAIPTETVYGLAADACNPTALQKIYQVKERPANNPLIVHLANLEQVEDWVLEFPPLARKLAKAFWPGPFTLVLKANKNVSKILTADQPTVALRVPNHPIILQLLAQSGLALAAPSANKYTQLSPTTAAHVEVGLGENIPVLEGGACKVGIESTIVHVFQDEHKDWQWQLLRQGMLSEAVIGQIAGISQVKQVSEKKMPKVPGQHLLHYSPRTPLSLLMSKEAIYKKVAALNLSNQSCAALLFDDENKLENSLSADRKLNCIIKTLPKNPTIYAEYLYAMLHELDQLGVQQLLIESPPMEVEWMPLLDRLQRAAHA